METRVWNLIETKTLVNGANWDDAKSTVCATIFGKMVELAKDRVEHYRSDLYHDALWLDRELKGPMQFDWIARESGTFIGEIVNHVKDDDWSKSVRYRFDIRLEGDRKWMLDIYEAGPIVPQSVHYCEECGTMVGHYVEDMSMWLCSTYCATKAQERLNPVPNVPDSVPWVDSHAALHVRDCDMAASAAGCIWHPAPVNGFPPAGCTGYNNWDGNVQHDGDTCPVHEDLNTEENILPDEFQPYFKDITDEDKERILNANFPTLRNTTSNYTKEITMDSILRDLREKASDAETAKDELEEKKYELDDAVSELENYLEEINNLIDSLDNLPEVSVSVEIDVSFDS